MCKPEKNGKRHSVFIVIGPTNNVNKIETVSFIAIVKMSLDSGEYYDISSVCYSSIMIIIGDEWVFFRDFSLTIECMLLFLGRMAYFNGILPFAGRNIPSLLGNISIYLEKLAFFRDKIAVYQGNCIFIVFYLFNIAFRRKSRFFLCGLSSFTLDQFPQKTSIL